RPAAASRPPGPALRARTAPAAKILRRPRRDRGRERRAYGRRRTSTPAVASGRPTAPLDTPRRRSPTYRSRPRTAATASPAKDRPWLATLPPGASHCNDEQSVGRGKDTTLHTPKASVPRRPARDAEIVARHE